MVDHFLAIECSMGISPGCLRGGSAGVSETEISARWAGRVVLLETGWLFMSGGFHPAQSLNCREIDTETMKPAALSFVGHAA